MAYGGMRVTPGLPIGERVSAATRALHQTAAHQTAAHQTAAHQTAGHSAGLVTPVATERPTRAEPPLHCWVTHPADQAADAARRSPGVLVEWQHDGDRWWGLVVFVADDSGHSMVVTRLVPAETLAPA